MFFNNKKKAKEEKEEKVLIFPNPTSKFLTIQTNKRIQIRDILSRPILEYQPVDFIRLDLSSFKNGVYFLQIDKMSYKFIKN